MTSVSNIPAFPEGSTVRDRATGRNYVSTRTTLPQDGQPDYWTIVHSPDGVDRQLPTGDLELVAL